MSSDLPSRPNFEYLKKRAKELLRQLQKQNPHAKLADAQHQIAREHGVLNWSQLKELVQSIANRPAPPRATGMFARFTARARQATFFSRFEAGQFGHPSIDPEHLLLGVIRARHDVAARVTSDARLSLDVMRATVCERRQADTPLSTSVIIAFSDDTKRAIDLAAAEADRLHHSDIGTPHLLLGILGDEPSLAASMLRDNGITIDAIRTRADEWMEEERTN
jgi:ATP-dependent Clp protease ATP-binding subunit ClpC